MAVRCTYPASARDGGRDAGDCARTRRDRESASQRLGDAEAQTVAGSSVRWKSNGREREREKSVG